MSGGTIDTKVNGESKIHSKISFSIVPDPVTQFKKRILEWHNPVEYVNNMYGCHPGDEEGGEDYFKTIFRQDCSDT